MQKYVILQWEHNNRRLKWIRGFLYNIALARLDLNTTMRMLAHQALLPPTTADCYRLLTAILVSRESSRDIATKSSVQFRPDLDFFDDLPHKLMAYLGCYRKIRHSFQPYLSKCIIWNGCNTIIIITFIHRISRYNFLIIKYYLFL